MIRMPDRRRLAGFAAALVAVCVWAGWIPMTRLAISARLTPEDVVALRYGVPGLLLAPYLMLRWRQVPWRRWGLLVALIVGAGAPYQLLFGHGLAVANSGQAAVLGPGLVSPLVVMLAMLFLGERPAPTRFAGLAVTLSGVAVVLAHDIAHGHSHLVGFALIVCASFLWAMYTTASRALGLNPFVNASLVAVVNALIYLPIYLACGGAARLAALPAGDLWLQGLYQGVLTAIVALVAFAFAVGRLGAAAAASVMPLSPVLVAIFGWFLLGDRIDAPTAWGLVAVGAGVLVANRRAKPGATSR